MSKWSGAGTEKSAQARLRSGKAGPEWEKSSAKGAASGRAALKMADKEPGVPRLLTNEVNPQRDFPETENCEPIPAEHRASSREPNCKESDAGVAEPGRARLRIKQDGSECARSGTETVGSSLPELLSSAAVPGRVKSRTKGKEPKWLIPKAEYAGPSLTGLCGSGGNPK